MSFWNGKRVLITGGSGFVGRWVGRALQPSRAELHILDLAPPQAFEVPFAFHRVDLRDLMAAQRLLKEVRPDVVIHLAGQPGVATSHENPVSAYESNVLATFNLLEACRLHGALEAIVAVSSNHVYGEQHNLPTPEEAPLNGTGTYAASKLCSDVLARAYGKSYALPVGIARMTNSYGGDDHHVAHIVTGTILAALRGDPPVIKQSGRDRKGYLYIKDTAQGLLAVAEGVAKSNELRGEAFNLVPDESITVLELVQLIIKIVGVELLPSIRQPDAAYEVEDLDNSKARRLLGWKPKHDYSSGFNETVDWYRRAGRFRT
jgi:CDP-glucose 4,6-dehydratase